MKTCLPYMGTHSHTHIRVSQPLLASRRLNLSQLCCNSSLLFNKQFVSDVSNASSNLIVGEMCMEVAACSLSPSVALSVQPALIFYPFLPLQVCVCVRAAWYVCVRVHYVCRDEDGGAILKGLQLHLNGVIGHDGWLLPFHNV